MLAFVTECLALQTYLNLQFFSQPMSKQKQTQDKRYVARPHIVKKVHMLGNSACITLTSQDRDIIGIEIGDNVTIFGGV